MGKDIDNIQDLIYALEMAISGYRGDHILRSMSFIMARISLDMPEDERKAMAEDFESATEVYRELMKKEGL